jgi:hypothetical protein
LANYQGSRAIEFFQRLNDRGAVSSDRAATFGFIYIPVPVGQLLNVAVEIQAHDFGMAIDEPSTACEADYRRYTCIHPPA